MAMLLGAATSHEAGAGILISGDERVCRGPELDRNPRAELRSGPGSMVDQLRNANLILISGAEVFAPQALGIADVLIAGNKIAAIGQSISSEHVAGLGGVVLNATGLTMVPGLVDIHAHIAGGGGELGEASRTPEAALSQLINAGVTTVVGILGTDGVGRSLESLHAKAAALARDGLSTYTWSGSYRCCPSLTLTGDLVRDIQLVPRVLGIGEIAISDHRSSWPSFAALAELAGNTRVAGMLSGKRGVTHLHVGTGRTGLKPLRDAVDWTGGALPADQFLPTHCSNRGSQLLAEAWEWIVDYQGIVDFTADAPTAPRNDTIDSILKWDSQGTDVDVLKRISVSSDAFGSFPEFDQYGKLISYSVSTPDSLLHLLRSLVIDHGWGLAKVSSRSFGHPPWRPEIAGLGWGMGLRLGMGRGIGASIDDAFVCRYYPW